MAKEARTKKAGPMPSSGEAEDLAGGGMANPVITNKGFGGGRNLETMIGAEKISGPNPAGKK